MSHITPKLTSGDVVGPFTIVEYVSGGGYGQVFRATGAGGEEVALKIAPIEHYADARAAERLIQEGRILRSLSHPNIVGFRKAGEQEDLLWLAMEFLRGETLQTRLERDGRVPLSVMTRLMIDYATGLEHAHQQGIIHRDIKPANLFIVDGGGTESGVLVDFGVARIGRGLNTTHNIGTPFYMAPDYLSPTPATVAPDPRWDIWPLGAVFYQSVAGRHPLVERGRSMADYDPLQRMFRVATYDPEPVSASVPGCPPRLGAAIMRCLARDPVERWQSCRELAAELTACLELLAHDAPTSDEVQILSVPFIPPTGVQEGLAAAAGEGAAARGEGAAAAVSDEAIDGLPAARMLEIALGEPFTPPPGVAHEALWHRRLFGDLARTHAVMARIVERAIEHMFGGGMALSITGLLQHANPWVQVAGAWMLIKRRSSLDLVDAYEARPSLPAWVRGLIEEARAVAATHRDGAILRPREATPARSGAPADESPPRRTARGTIARAHHPEEPAGAGNVRGGSTIGRSRSVSMSPVEV